MKKTIDSSTLHNSVMWSSQENLQENNTGANSMPTPSPQGAHKWNIVQSSPEEFDAVARADDDIEYKYSNEWSWKDLSTYWKHKVRDLLLSHWEVSLAIQFM